MDFYLDEQLPKRIANALDVLEKHEAINRVFSTETEFGKGVKDPDLYPLIKKANGILITHDLKMVTRKNEFALIKNFGITVFIISPSCRKGLKCNYKSLQFSVYSLQLKMQAKNRKRRLVSRKP